MANETDKNVLTFTELYIILVLWTASQNLFSGLLKDVPVYYLSKHMNKYLAQLTTAIVLFLLTIGLFFLFRDIQLGATGLVKLNTSPVA